MQLIEAVRGMCVCGMWYRVTVHRTVWLRHPNTGVHRRPNASNQPNHLRQADCWGRPLSNESDGTSRRIAGAAVSPSNATHEAVLVPSSMWWTRLRCSCIDVRSVATQVLSTSFLRPVRQRQPIRRENKPPCTHCGIVMYYWMIPVLTVTA